MEDSDSSAIKLLRLRGWAKALFSKTLPSPPFSLGEAASGEASYKSAVSWEKEKESVPAALIMSPALLLALLGITHTLTGVHALTCNQGSAETVRDISELPLQWTTGQKSCEDGWGCQEVLLLIENELQVNLMILKGCTQAANQEARVTQHRTGPGLSALSYTHVCREDLCNNLSSTVPLRALPPPTAMGSVRCPVCLSTAGCGSAAELPCPIESSHCYSGVLLFSGAISSRLKVQGCTSQEGCNLLNGTREIGPITLRETCDPQAFLSCHRGVMLRTSVNLAQEPVEWTTNGRQLCDPGEVCQETLLLIDVGHKSLLVGSKGCSKARTQDSQTISIHSGPPGVLVASYARFCSSDECNSASSSSVLLNSLPRPAAPASGDLYCPACVSLFGSCPENSETVRCPSGTTHCYKGYIALQGGGLSTSLNVQGCVAQPSSYLLNRIQNIGVISVAEKRDDENEPLENELLLPAGAAPAPYLAWVVGLGLSLALWCGAPSLLIPFSHDS
ncbi:CD177 antigen [Camelus bactrianus]|uniref:CD177 antigen n=1 Tax=Camelus bactrianus TaxID=9837 RepID=A0A9W3EEA4_CAMBA|nr:CD177 antigen [Camelus bactrianus]